MVEAPADHDRDWPTLAPVRIKKQELKNEDLPQVRVDKYLHHQKTFPAADVPQRHQVRQEIKAEYHPNLGSFNNYDIVERKNSLKASKLRQLIFCCSGVEPEDDHHQEIPEEKALWMRRRRGRRVFRAMLGIPSVAQQQHSGLLGSPSVSRAPPPGYLLGSPGRNFAINSAPSPGRNAAASPGRAGIHGAGYASPGRGLASPSPRSSPSSARHLLASPSSSSRRRRRKARRAFSLTDAMVAKVIKSDNYGHQELVQEPSSPEISCIGRIKKEAQCKHSISVAASTMYNPNPNSEKNFNLRSNHRDLHRTRSANYPNSSSPESQLIIPSIAAATQRFGKSKLSNLHKLSAVHDNRNIDQKITSSSIAISTVNTECNLNTNYLQSPSPNHHHHKPRKSYSDAIPVEFIYADHHSRKNSIESTIISSSDQCSRLNNTDNSDKSDSAKSNNYTNQIVINPPPNCLSLMRSASSSRRNPADFGLSVTT